MPGKLFVIGVGPGDTGLVCIKAAEILQRVKKIFIPVSGQGRDSLAYEIANNYIPADTTVSELVFPMTTDRQALSRAYLENYERITTVLRQGYDTALITIGDPGMYSTASQVVSLLRKHAADITVETVPGITSFADAAARAGMPLVEGNEIFSVVSSYDDTERLAAILDASDTVVFLKTYKKRTAIIELLKKKNLLQKAVYIRRSGLDGEDILHDLEKLPEELDYLSLIIVKKNISS
jgi:precorrin-2/cobalt-factor-2 C20-methyltransferase